MADKSAPRGLARRGTARCQRHFESGKKVCAPVFVYFHTRKIRDSVFRAPRHRGVCHAKGSTGIGQNAAEIGAAMWGGRWLPCGAFWRAAGAPRPAAILLRNHRLSRPLRRPGASLGLAVRYTGRSVGNLLGDRPVRAVVLLVARVAVMNQLIDIVGDGKRCPAAVRRPFMWGLPCSGLLCTVRVRGEVKGPI